MTLKEILENDQKYYTDPAPQLPWSVQMCITYGCNRAPFNSKLYIDDRGEVMFRGGCGFCGIWSMIDKKEDRIGFNFMSIDTAINLAKQLNDWVPGRRIEINNFGEPWINPHWGEIIKAIRDNYPSGCIQLQTNGVNLHKKGYESFKEYLDKFFSNGGNLLAIDAYEGSYNDYIKLATQYGKENNIKVIDFMHHNPDNMTYYRNAGPNSAEIYIVDDLGECDYKLKTNKDKKAQRNINNHAGCMNPEVWYQYGIDKNKLPLQKTCSRVYRELICGFDGTITICCQDFLRRINLGNIRNENIRDIWNSTEFNTIRRKLYDKDRSFCNTCMYCSYGGGFRVGLMKRPEGEVTDNDLKVLFKKQEQLSDYVHYNSESAVYLSNGEKLLSKSTMSRNDNLSGKLQ